MDSIDYKRLYELQDRVLDKVFTIEDEFYLTGGTALSRFYEAKRYSDDLDFFTNNSTRFNFAVKNIVAEFSKEFSVKYELDSRDFVRVKLDALLQVDFVNDRVPRFKEPKVLENGYKIDIIENILSNKITAVMGRDNPKDIFDIYLIGSYYEIDWKEIINSAQEKMFFSIDDLMVRFRSFPHFLLKSINLIESDFLDSFEDDFDILIESIEKTF
ncbi:MAG: nucleotidyl transferase AbiEii/AbiGii toxin family protein [Epsilonproteobacteria bacterium]|nr:nucleotidyl transferase AbiEii/AbiGii toxin family protein [Campylobacterota bacterium]